MKTVQNLMKFSELRELSKIPYIKFQEIEHIMTKPFLELTVGDFEMLCATSIFDASFVTILFNELYERYLSSQINPQK